MEAFLARNFYPTLDLTVCPVRWGHWSDVRVNKEGNPLGKLFGGHGLPNVGFLANAKVVYIYRDGRAVANSIWHTPNFLHPAVKEQHTFSEFLQMPLDWFCAPEIRSTMPRTIAEHWHHHVSAWHRAAKSRKNVLVVRYEELKSDPDAVYARVLRSFFAGKYVLRSVFGSRHELDPIAAPVGLLPNQGAIDSWRHTFSAEDEALFVSQLPSTSFLWQ